MSQCGLCELADGVVLKNQYWTMAVNKNQATLGRVFFAMKRHETDVAALTQAERDSLWQFLAEAKSALSVLFSPDHFNYMFHMNIDPHVHMHIYPRYRESRQFQGETFSDGRYGDHYDPTETRFLSDDMIAQLAALLRREITQPSRNPES